MIQSRVLRSSMGWTLYFESCKWKIYFIKRKLYLSLYEIVKKLESIFMEEWEVFDRMTLGWFDSHCLHMLPSLNEMITVNLMVALTRMYEKSLASNKVFFDKVIVQYEDGW